MALGLGARLWKTQPPVPIEQAAPESRGDRIFREWREQAPLIGAAVGFCVLDEQGKTVFASPLAETALCPASALKTVTTGAALGILGPDFRFETTLAATAPIDVSGSIDGNLVLIGGGDPTLAQEDLRKLADTAIVAGLKNVSGRLMVDASFFPDGAVSDHWNWGDIGNAYGAGAYGLNLDHNRLTIRFDPGAQLGAPAKFLGGAPAPRETQWENRVITGAAGSGDQVVVYSTPFGRSIRLRGTVPLAQSGFTIGGANPDPPAVAAELLRARLESAGVKFGERTAPEGKRVVLAVHQSAPLPEIIDHLHRVSDNLEAQCLFLALGQRAGAAPAEVVRRYWEKAGIAFAGLRVLDGSGLARANMIRPLDLARVNLAARRGPHGQRFYESLTATSGGAVRGKNGAMSGVRTEVGFLRTAAGGELTFALMASGLQPGIDFWGLRGELLSAFSKGED